jgi:hypothetical protein
MGLRFAVHARASRQVALLLVAFAAVADASPKGTDAKAAFDKGIAAYKRKDYAAAALARAKSNYLEPDLETEFAWAQAERKAGNCAKAIQLYEKLLVNPALPSANRKAVQKQLEECKVIVDAQPKPDKPVDKAPPPQPPKSIETVPEKAPPVNEGEGPTSLFPPPSNETPARGGGRAWWKDPIGGSMVTLGVISGAVGGYFLYSAHAADIKAHDPATRFFEARALLDKAKSRGTVGVIGTAAGSMLVLGGIVWYATRPSTRERGAQVTGWVDAAGGGIAASGRF